MRLFNSKLENHFNWKESDDRPFGLAHDYLMCNDDIKEIDHNLMVWSIQGLRVYIDGNRLERSEMKLLAGGVYRTLYA